MPVVCLTRRLAAILALSCLNVAALAGSVTVVTPFPRELTQAYKQAFEKINPDIRLEFLNKGTGQGIAHVRELPAGQRPEVFWTSAPDAFNVMAAQRLLEPVSGLINKAAPTKVGDYPINDPKGLYLGQALAGYGIMWNKRYLTAHKLPTPAQWDDLAKPIYHGHVAMSSPTRSGTTHLTVETMLQGEGWDKGWSQLLQIAGNCVAITERSTGVPDGVNSGQFGIDLVIDSYGLASKYSGHPVDFVYPAVTTVVPANIALVAGSRNPGEARKFIAFTLSAEGQLLLLDPRIARLPILPLKSLGGKVPPGYPNGFEVAKRAKVRFDSDLSETRYNVLASLFDQTITFRLKDLQAATVAIHEAEALLLSKPQPQAAALIKRARDLAFSPVVGPQLAVDRNFLATFSANKKSASANAQSTGLEDRWSHLARDRYQAAQTLAFQASALLR